jgi:hypothetical protein
MVVMIWMVDDDMFGDFKRLQVLTCTVASDGAVHHQQQAAGAGLAGLSQQGKAPPALHRLVAGSRHVEQQRAAGSVVVAVEYHSPAVHPSSVVEELQGEGWVRGLLQLALRAMTSVHATMGGQRQLHILRGLRTLLTGSNARYLNACAAPWQGHAARSLL